MLIPKRVLEAFDLKLEELNNETNFKDLVPNYNDIKKAVIRKTNKIYEKYDIDLKDLEERSSSRRRTKNRWLKVELTSDINKRKMVELTKWLESDIPLIKYPYIHKKTGKSLTSAMKNDMEIELYKLIIAYEDMDEEDISRDKKREISKVANMLTSIPYNTSTDGRFERIGEIFSYMGDSVEATSKSIKTENYVFIMEFDDNEPKTALELKSPSNVKKALNRISQVINSTDRKIINYLISRSGAEFIYTGRITNVPITDIIKNVFETDAGDNYITIKSSIFKMERIRGYIGNKKSVAPIGLLSYFEFITEGKIDFVTVEIHSYIREEIIKKQTINLYKDIIDTCPDDDAELLLFFLQKKRLGQILSNGELTITVNWRDYFSEAIIFTNKRKDRNIARLIKSLDFIEGTNSVLKYYERKKDDITLVFKEMTDDELADLNYEDIFSSDEYAEFRNKLIGEPKFEISKMD